MTSTLTRAAFLAALAVPSAARAQASAPAQPCPAERVGGAAAWRIVRGEGFTFCLPTDWQPSSSPRGAADPESWFARGLKVEWSRGRPQLLQRTETRRVTRDELAELQEEMRAQRSTRSTETVEGLRISVATHRNTRTGNTIVIAEWGGRGRGHLFLEDPAGAHAPLLLQIVRSVRADSTDAAGST